MSRNCPTDVPELVRAAEAQARADRMARESAERDLAILLGASQALRAWDCFQESAERLLGGLAGALDLPAAALWLPQDGVLVARATWSIPSLDRAALEQALGQVQLPSGVGLAGSAWQRRGPVNRASTGTDAPLSRGQPALPGLRPALGLPALAGEEVLGVVELYSTSEVELSERLVDVLSWVGVELGTLLARRRGGLRASHLTARELEVLTLVAQGLRRRKIAEQLSISPATVKTHLENVYRKLEVSDRVTAVASALRAGLIE
jgi:DNA-binding CsgD family transcriptional regulator